MFVLFYLLRFPVGTLVWLCFQVCVLASFVSNWLISFLASFAHQVTLLHFLFSPFFFFLECFGIVCVRESSFVFVIICLISYLPFVWDSSFISCCFCVFNAITNGLWNLGSLARDWPCLWSGRAESRTLDCQRTPDPREY